MKNVNLHLNYTVKSLCQFRLEEHETLPLLYIWILNWLQISEERCVYLILMYVWGKFFQENECTVVYWNLHIFCSVGNNFYRWYCFYKTLFYFNLKPWKYWIPERQALSGPWPLFVTPLEKKWLFDNFKACVYIVTVMWYGVLEICVEDSKWTDRDLAWRAFMGQNAFFLWNRMHFCFDFRSCAMADTR